MSVVRSAIAAAELTVAVVGIAVTVSRHPLFKAGLRAAPHVIPPAMRQSAADAVLEAAFRAGAAARRVLPRSLVG